MRDWFNRFWRATLRARACENVLVVFYSAFPWRSIHGHRKATRNHQALEPHAPGRRPDRGGNPHSDPRIFCAARPGKTRGLMRKTLEAETIGRGILSTSAD